MQSKQLHYTDGKRKFVGHLVWDETATGPRPGVVVFPEAFGLNDHARQRAERLAQQGFVALAADPHGEAAVFNDMAALGPAIRPLYEWTKTFEQFWRHQLTRVKERAEAQAQKQIDLLQKF